MANMDLLPKWIMKRYLILWNSVGKSEFDLDLAVKSLSKMKKPDERKMVILVLSELRKNGWLETRFDPDDARKHLYKLLPYEDIFNEIVNKNLKEDVS